MGQAMGKAEVNLMLVGMINSLSTLLLAAVEVGLLVIGGKMVKNHYDKNSILLNSGPILLFMQLFA